MTIFSYSKNINNLLKPIPQIAKARDITEILDALFFNNILPHASIVAPVVMTSSTNNMCLPAILFLFFNAKLLLTLTILSSLLLLV